MRILVSDRQSIERGVLAKTNYVVISIHDPDKPKAKVRRTAGLKATLVLPFNDTEPLPGRVLPSTMRVMSADQAAEIVEFVNRHKAEVGTIVVHCEQGMSRSPAVAAAVCKLLGGDDRRFFREYQPNEFVYRLVLEAHSKEAESGTVDDRAVGG
jgi:predicted protein tyrosine phosphatase